MCSALPGRRAPPTTMPLVTIAMRCHNLRPQGEGLQPFVCSMCCRKTSTGNHDASAEDATCDATICGINEKIVSHMCLHLCNPYSSPCAKGKCWGGRSLHMQEMRSLFSSYPYQLGQQCLCKGQGLAWWSTRASLANNAWVRARVGLAVLHVLAWPTMLV